MSRRNRRRGKDDDVSTSSWMDTYADTITLLLAFFILLYSISAVDSQKLSELSKALQSSLGGNASIENVENINDLKVQVNDKILEKEDLAEKVNKAVQENNLQDVVKVREEDRGVVLQLDENILYDLGKSDLKDTSIKALDTITKLVKDMDNDVLVEGHTDNVPIHNSEYASNWELSTARAVSVVRYFVETKDVQPTRFAVKGYAEFRPLVDNSTPENRSTNRRVDILIVDKNEKIKQQDNNKSQEPQQSQGTKE
ncbi:OmpA family protein [Paraclostridium ghonii]|uniref:Chemotaxis protein MotB n=1 Tax=Paraclostridium ghonii TaxID=29358 RepID=A0ABU0MWC6_9FIRM|nr:OmpA family protein [Paeniclostridium ghonii]MDQ0555207.1 chemotaxis protein MotB [Paeniclostridium ghonii]